MKLSRIKSQEGYAVHRWFEGNKGIIASVVKGDIPNEAEIRISGNKFDAFKIRGDKSIILKKSDEELKALIRHNIQFRKQFEKTL